MKNIILTSSLAAVAVAAIFLSGCASDPEVTTHTSSTREVSTQPAMTTAPVTTTISQPTTLRRTTTTNSSY